MDDVLADTTADLVADLVPDSLGASAPSVADIFGASTYCYVIADGDEDLTFSGADVIEWDDRGGSGRDLNGASAPPLYVASGINGRPCLRFDGVAEFMFWSAAGAYSNGDVIDLHVVAHIRSAPGSGNDEVLAHMGANGDYKLEPRNTAGTSRMRSFGTCVNYTGTNLADVIDTSGLHVYSLTTSGSKLSQWRDNSETPINAADPGGVRVVATPSLTIAANPVLGNTEWCEVDVYEIVIALNASATQANRATYVNDRASVLWGV